MNRKKENDRSVEAVTLLLGEFDAMCGTPSSKQMRKMPD